MVIHEIANKVLRRDASQRSLSSLLEDAQAAAQRLSIATRSWPTFMPSRAALDEAGNTLEGLRITLAELQGHTTQK
jgi:hypothetical protein